MPRRTPLGEVGRPKSVLGAATAKGVGYGHGGGEWASSFG